MKADIIRVDMSMDLETGAVVTTARLRVGTVEIDAQIDPASAELIMGASVQNGTSLKVANGKSSVEHQFHQPYTPPEPHPFVTEVQEPSGPNQDEPYDDELVRWADLPDTELSPLMKQIFTDSGIPDEIPAQDVGRLVEEILENMQPEEPPASEPEPPKPTVGKLQVREVAPRRTVATDSAGYPVLPGVDPGEIVGGDGDDFDEDGVGQL